MNVLEQSERISQFKLQPFQDKFFFSKVRFLCFCAGWCTGKTMMLLLKAWDYCQQYPNQYVWFIRKERIDLEDSTMRDFEKYFNTIIPSDRNFKFQNGSIISFRHGGEVTLNNLKNVNLSSVFVEQSEEFSTDQQFQMLRGRIRNPNAPYHQICITANANGHNWIWKTFKNNPPSKEYELVEATSFENAKHIPKDTLADWERLKEEAPNQYQRYILNSHEEAISDDALLTWENLMASTELIFGKRSAKRILGIDVARFGDDETVFTILDDRENMHWEQTHQEGYHKKDLSWTIGRAVDLRKQYKAHYIVPDDDGVGGGVTDGLGKDLGLPVHPFHAEAKPKDPETYENAKAEGYFQLQELINNGFLKIYNDQQLIDELMTIKFRYKKGKRSIVSKEEMRKEGIKSPSRADALMMAVYLRNKGISTFETIKALTPIRQTRNNAGISFSK